VAQNLRAVSHTPSSKLSDRLLNSLSKLCANTVKCVKLTFLLFVESLLAVRCGRSTLEVLLVTTPVLSDEGSRAGANAAAIALFGRSTLEVLLVTTPVLPDEGSRAGANAAAIALFDVQKFSFWSFPEMSCPLAVAQHTAPSPGPVAGGSDATTCSNCTKLRRRELHLNFALSGDKHRGDD